MKQIVILLVQIYQRLGSPFLKGMFGVSAMCKYHPSCSEYAKHSILKYGVIKGGYRSIARIVSCQPFFNSKFKMQNYNSKVKIVKTFLL